MTEPLTNPFLIIIRIKEAATFAEARAIHDEAYRRAYYRQDKDALHKALSERPDHLMRKP